MHTMERAGGVLTVAVDETAGKKAQKAEGSGG